MRDCLGRLGWSISCLLEIVLFVLIDIGRSSLVPFQSLGSGLYKDRETRQRTKQADIGFSVLLTASVMCQLF